jgi:hypothetical protein
MEPAQPRGQERIRDRHLIEVRRRRLACATGMADRCTPCPARWWPGRLRLSRAAAFPQRSAGSHAPPCPTTRSGRSHRQITADLRRFDNGPRAASAALAQLPTVRPSRSGARPWPTVPTRAFGQWKGPRIPRCGPSCRICGGNGLGHHGGRRLRAKCVADWAGPARVRVHRDDTCPRRRQLLRRRGPYPHRLHPAKPALILSATERSLTPPG